MHTCLTLQHLVTLFWDLGITVTY